MSKKEISNEPIYLGLDKIAPKNKAWKIYSIILTVILALIVFAVLAACVFFCIFKPVVSIKITGNGAYAALSPTEIIEENVSAVVAIQTQYYDGSGIAIVGTGSGFIVDASGYIVTNDHVVDNGGSISVYLKNSEGGKKEYSARIVGSNAYYDVAVLKIFADDENYKFPTVKLGQAKDLVVGEQVVAIGSPQEIAYAWTSTVGYVSSDIRNFLESGNVSAKKYIQFDAAVNGGNSGGPLFDSKGRVVGIVEKKVSNNEGMGLAIPIESVSDIINSFIKDDREKPQLGIVGVSVEEGVEYFMEADKLYVLYLDEESGIKFFVSDLVNIVELTEDVAKTGEVFISEANGFRVKSVNPSSGAYGMIQPGDIIISFDGIELFFDEVTTPYDIVIQTLATKKAGDVVEIKFVRNGQVFAVNVRLTAKK